MDINDVTYKIIGAAINVHHRLGPGLLESVYETCLAHELPKFGLRFQRQVAIAVNYDGLVIDCGYRADFMVEESVIVELKSVANLGPIHLAQMFTYLKLSGCRCGLLINFNVKLLPDGIKRVSL